MDFILDEDGQFLLDEDGERILEEGAEEPEVIWEPEGKLPSN